MARSETDNVRVSVDDPGGGASGTHYAAARSSDVEAASTGSRRAEAALGAKAACQPAVSDVERATPVDLAMAAEERRRQRALRHSQAVTAALHGPSHACGTCAGGPLGWWRSL